MINISLTNACIIQYNALSLGRLCFGNLAKLIYRYSRTSLQALSDQNFLPSDECKSVYEINIKFLNTLCIFRVSESVC